MVLIYLKEVIYDRNADKKLQETYETAWPVHKKMIDEWKSEGMTAEQILPYSDLFM